MPFSREIVEIVHNVLEAGMPSHEHGLAVLEYLVRIPRLAVIMVAAVVVPDASEDIGLGDDIVILDGALLQG